jgi:hypothetical protein
MPSTDNPASWNDVLSNAKQLSSAVKDNVPKHALEIPTAHAFILGMFWRTVRLYDGTLLLPEAQFPEEAAILARSLFEESLRLRQLGADKANRDALILGWANTSINEKIGLIKVAESVGLEPDSQPLLAALDEERSKLQGYAQRHRVVKFIPFLSVKDAALRFGRMEDYWTYSWSNESVHGSDAAWLFGRRKIATDTIGLFAKTNNPGLCASIAAFAAVSLIDAASAVSSIFGWAAFASAREICTRIQGAADAYASQ